MSDDSAQLPFRILPEVTPQNEHFWCGGGDGALHVLRCVACRSWLHPPAPICPECLSDSVRAETVSGRATLVTWTVNHHPWIPGFPPPYVLAIVELAEQSDLRITTNLVHCREEAIAIGMPLRVCFEARDGGIFLPLFEPEEAAARTPAGSAGKAT